MVHGVNVDVEGPLPTLGIHFEQAAGSRAACAVHEDVQPAEKVDRPLHTVRRLDGIGDIGRDGQSLALHGFYFPLYLLGERVVSREAAYRDVRPSKSEIADCSCAYAATPSRDQTNLPF
jgi:hypothetical protein